MKNKKILSFIERTVFWEGNLSVKYLSDYFNITENVAQNFISEYISANPANITVNDKKSCYCPDDTNFIFEFAENNYYNILSTFAEQNAPFYETLPLLQPVFDKEMLRNLIRAMTKRDLILRIRYQSLNSQVTEERNIIPYSIYYVRGRYHVRAFCLAKKAFRDFVLSRIISIVQTSQYKGDQITDLENSEFITVTVKPHSALSEMQKMSTEMEFCMTNGMKNIKVKKSLLIYLLDELRVGKDYYKPPFTVLELVNKKEINGILKPKNVNF